MRVWYEPVRSTCAPAGMANAIRAHAASPSLSFFMLNSRKPEGFGLPSSKPRVAGLRVPFASVRLFLEMDRRYPRSLQVGRVVHRIGDDEIFVAVGLGVD